jgi:hypothetical protein
MILFILTIDQILKNNEKMPIFYGFYEKRPRILQAFLRISYMRPTELPFLNFGWFDIGQTGIQFHWEIHHFAF